MTARRAHVCSVTFFANEYWFGRRLLRLGIDLSGGVTDPAERQGRARRGLLERGLAKMRVFPSKPDTYGDLYERFYGEPLSTPTPSDATLSQSQQFKVAL